jgi:Carboxypeptidase regulatory-like domain
MHIYKAFFALAFCLLCSRPGIVIAQPSGKLSGKVTLGDTGKPIHNVRITIIQLKRSEDTDENGRYEFQGVPPGKYDVTAHLDLAPDVLKTVQVETGATTADFQIKLTAVRESVTVTATGSEETTFSSIQSVTVNGWCGRMAVGSVRANTILLLAASATLTPAP